MDKFFEQHRSKVETFKETYRKKVDLSVKVNIPDHLFVKCDHCNELIYRSDLEENFYVCPHCNEYFTLNARNRLEMNIDDGTFEELFPYVMSSNPLLFQGYESKIENYQEKTSEIEAFVCGVAKIYNRPVAIGALDSTFMMGSMGSVVGEKVTRLAEYATKNKLPLIIFSASGGARMQEGIFSLMQMAKTSAALEKHAKAGLLYISVLTHPTTGGVAASFATLGDINIAEEGALIGFAGQRVIKQTIGENLPVGFQTAEFQLEKGMVDFVVKRKDMKKTIVKLLRFHQGN